MGGQEQSRFSTSQKENDPKEAVMGGILHSPKKEASFCYRADYERVVPRNTELGTHAHRV